MINLISTTLSIYFVIKTLKFENKVTDHTKQNRKNLDLNALGCESAEVHNQTAA